MTLISIRNAVALKAAEQAIAAQAAAQRKRMVEAERLALESRVGAGSWPLRRRRRSRPRPSTTR